MMPSEPRASASGFLAALFLAASAFGAQDPVQWKLALDQTAAGPGQHVLARFAGTIESGWHLYSLTTPKGGPNPTKVGLADNPAVASVKVYQPKPERHFDPNFQLDIELKKDAAAGPFEIAAQARYQCCTDKICLPPKTKTAAATLTIDPAATSQAIAIPAGYEEFRKPTAAAPAPTAKPQSDDLWSFLLIAFGAGLAAIFTPCVFPMIPFTVSYFLKRQTSVRRDSAM